MTCDHADPTLTMFECDWCAAAMRRTFNEVLPELELGPNGVVTLMQSIREIASAYAAQGPAA